MEIKVGYILIDDCSLVYKVIQTLSNCVIVQPQGIKDLGCEIITYKCIKNEKWKIMVEVKQEKEVWYLLKKHHNLGVHKKTHKLLKEVSLHPNYEYKGYWKSKPKDEYENVQCFQCKEIFLNDKQHRCNESKR